MKYDPHQNVALTARDIALMKTYAPDLAAAGYVAGDETSRGIRDAIYAAADTAKTQAKAAREAAKTDRIAELEGRVAAIENFLGARGERFMDALAAALVKNLPHLIRSLGYMRHAGTWEGDKAYDKGTCTIYDGSTWLAVGDVAKGARPGKALEWRMIARGEAR